MTSRAGSRTPVKARSHSTRHTPPHAQRTLDWTGRPCLRVTLCVCSWPLCPELGPALQHPTRVGVLQTAQLASRAFRPTEPEAPAGLERVAVGEEERTHALDSGTSAHTRAGKSRDSSWDSGRSKRPISWDGMGAHAQLQPMQDDSTWLNKPFGVFRSRCFLRGAGMQAGDLSPPPITSSHVLLPPHCSQSTATRVRVKWGKGHVTGKPQVALSCW